MGPKLLVNQSFPFKNDLTTLGKPYIATAQFVPEDRGRKTEVREQKTEVRKNDDSDTRLSTVFQLLTAGCQQMIMGSLPLASLR